MLQFYHCFSFTCFQGCNCITIRSCVCCCQKDAGVAGKFGGCYDGQQDAWNTYVSLLPQQFLSYVEILEYFGVRCLVCSSVFRRKICIQIQIYANVQFYMYVLYHCITKNIHIQHVLVFTILVVLMSNNFFLLKHSSRTCVLKSKLLGDF